MAVVRNLKNATASIYNIRHMKYIITTLLLFVATWSFGQDGKIQIIEDKGVDDLLTKKIESADSVDLWGYRIQVYFGSDRTEAIKLQNKIKSMYAEQANEVYLDYYQPNWRVRVGNFYKKIDAQKLMYELQEEFGDVFLVRDKIELPYIEPQN